MADKFTLKYRRIVPPNMEKGQSTQAPGSRNVSYLHNHRVKDALQEYLDQLEE